jgi:hypothetical protein
MAANQHGQPNLRPDWPVVYTETLRPGQRAVSIITDGNAWDAHTRKSFSIHPQTGAILQQQTGYTKPIDMQERGWFQNIALFSQLCLNEPIPAHANQVFDTWVDNIMSTIRTHHPQQMAFNDGS